MLRTVAVYIDPLIKSLPARRKTHGAAEYSRLWADDLKELHAFARKIGVKRDSFVPTQGSFHYTLTPEQRKLALAFGAVAKSHQDWADSLKPLPRPVPGVEEEPRY